MKCPKCDSNLKTTAINDIEVDKCDVCSGVWFDFGELEKVLEQDDLDKLRNVITNNEGHDEARGGCPRCGGKGQMIPVLNKKHNIHIDTCSVCYGQWLDGGEFEELKKKSFLDNILNIFRRK